MTDAFLLSLLQMTEAEARTKISNAGYKCRILIRDGHFHPMTADVKLDRVNLNIFQGKVIDVQFG